MSNWLFEEITYIAQLLGKLRVILFCLKGMSCRLPAYIFRSAEDGRWRREEGTAMTAALKTRMSMKHSGGFVHTLWAHLSASHEHFLTLLGRKAEGVVRI